jgi:hypothetical protein
MYQGTQLIWARAGKDLAAKIPGFSNESIKAMDQHHFVKLDLDPNIYQSGKLEALEGHRALQGPHQSERLVPGQDPNPDQSEKQYPDPHQGDVDPQHCIKGKPRVSEPTSYRFF